MVGRSTRRLTTAILVVLSLLFSQLALANYVCPGNSGQDHAVMEMAPGEPCEGMASDSGQTVLCYQHCNDAPQSPDSLKLPTVSLPSVVHVLVLAASIDPAAQEAELHASAGAAQPPPEPLFLSTLRLRV